MVKIKADSLRLINLRVREGLSITEFSKKVGVSQPTISRIESGKFSLSPFLANKIAVTLKVPFDDIFSIVEGD